MDPITAAIVAGIAAGAASGTTETAKQAIVDGYNGLKGLIRRKFGEDSKIVQAVAELESEPDFKPNQEALAGRVAQVKAEQDEELLKAAQELLEQVKAQPGGEKHVQQVIGSSHVAQAMGEGATAIVGDSNRVTTIRQQAGDHAIQIGQARDVDVKREM